MIFSARMFGVEGGSRPWRWAGALALVAATLAGCAQPPSPQARRHSNEYFSQAKYGPASPRVVEDGEPVPRGGGQYLVGHPYTIAGRTYYPARDRRITAPSAWPPGTATRSTGDEPPTAKSTTCARSPRRIRPCRCPATRRVTNLANGYSIIVRVNDRGPYHGGRVMDVSSRVADALDFKNSGTAKIKVDYIGPAPLEGSDDSVLLASLRTDGAPATIDGLPSGAPAMVASAAPASLLPSFVRPAAPPPPAADPAPERALAVAAPNPKLLKAPPPPPRPFDLGAIARAIGPVAAAPAVPPRRPVRQAMAGDRALYFAQSDGAAARLLRHDPFAGLIEQGDAPGSRGPLANDR